MVIDKLYNAIMYKCTHSYKIQLPIPPARDGWKS